MISKKGLKLDFTIQRRREEKERRVSKLEEKKEKERRETIKFSENPARKRARILLIRWNALKYILCLRIITRVPRLCKCLIAKETR